MFGSGLLVWKIFQSFERIERSGGCGYKEREHCWRVRKRHLLHQASLQFAGPCRSAGSHLTETFPKSKSPCLAFTDNSCTKKFSTLVKFYNKIRKKKNCSKVLKWPILYLVKSKMFHRRHSSFIYCSFDISLTIIQKKNINIII